MLYMHGCGAMSISERVRECSLTIVIITAVPSTASHTHLCTMCTCTHMVGKAKQQQPIFFNESNLKMHISVTLRMYSPNVTLSAKTDHLGLFYNFHYACKLMGGAYFRHFR